MTRPKFFSASKSKSAKVLSHRDKKVSKTNKLPSPKDHDDPSPELDGERLKRAYIYECRYARALNGDSPCNYVPSLQFDRKGTWVTVAQKLRKLGYDPMLYTHILIFVLRRQIFFNPKYYNMQHKDYMSAERHDQDDLRPPTPEQLAEKRYQNFVESFNAESRGNARKLWDSAMLNVRMSWVELSSYGDIPKDNMEKCAIARLQDKTPLFTFMYATKSIKLDAKTTAEKESNRKWQKMCEDSYYAACFQYLYMPKAFEEVWIGEIPELIVKTAKGTYEKFLFQHDISKNGSVAINLQSLR
ncbi:MAG: hypothetical protein AB7I37_12265 [Pirellulales bacterium]